MYYIITLDFISTLYYMSKLSKELKLKKIEELEKLKNELKLLNEEDKPDIKEAGESDNDIEIQKPKKEVKPTEVKELTQRQLDNREKRRIIIKFTYGLYLPTY